jgi:hypothetical protein
MPWRIRESLLKKRDIDAFEKVCETQIQQVFVPLITDNCEMAS